MRKLSVIIEPISLHRNSFSTLVTTYISMGCTGAQFGCAAAHYLRRICCTSCKVPGPSRVEIHFSSVRRLDRMPPHSPERRRSARLHLQIPVFLRGVDSAGAEFLDLTKTIDISATGALLLSTPRPLSRSAPSLHHPGIERTSFRICARRDCTDSVAGRALSRSRRYSPDCHGVSHAARLIAMPWKFQCEMFFLPFLTAILRLLHICARTNTFAASISFRAVLT